MRANKIMSMCLRVLLILVFTPALSRAAGMDYLGSRLKGNYVWGGAMNMAWHEMTDKILHAKLKLNTGDKAALEMADKFNRSPFSKNDLDKESYYVKSGFGQGTLDIINKESRLKFPGKSLGDINAKLGPKDFISYAYFLKQVEYLTQFEEKEVNFGEKIVQGFYASNGSQRKNVEVLEYSDDDRFIIGLRLKDKGDELLLAKGFDMGNPEAVVSQIAKYGRGGFPNMGGSDRFEMPKLHLQHHRDYNELVNKPFSNRGFEGYSIAMMFENIKFDMDQKGARVENEAVMGGRGGRPAKPVNVRRFILDKPFWVVMKRKDSQYPYFLLGVENTELMQKVDGKPAGRPSRQ
ncbi:MAG: hypothetical protein ACLP2U_11790 [Syntrophobacteraceae bacterium]